MTIIWSLNILWLIFGRDFWNFRGIKRLAYLIWNDFFIISNQENFTLFGSFSATVALLDRSRSRYSWTGASFSYHIVSSSCIFTLPFMHRGPVSRFLVWFIHLKVVAFTKTIPKSTAKNPLFVTNRCFLLTNWQNGFIPII